METVTNQSLSGMILRILRWTHANVSGTLISRIAILLALARVSFVFYRTRACKGAEDLEWATLVAIMIIDPPHNQNYYLMFRC